MTRPYATTTVKFTMNLDARESALASASFDPSDSTTYHYKESIAVYDSLGVTHTLESFFVKTDTNEWAVFVTADGINTVNAAMTAPLYTPNGTIQFPATGTGINPTFAPSDISVWFAPYDGSGYHTGAAIVSISLDLSEATQFGANFSSTLEQDGGFFGDLTFTGTTDSDNFIGEKGDDLVIFNYNSANVTSIGREYLNSNYILTITGPEGMDTLTNIEGIRFVDTPDGQVVDTSVLIPVSAADKIISGENDSTDTIISSQNTEVINALDGNDNVYGVKAGMTVDGGNGVDRVYFNFASTEVDSIARTINGSIVLTMQQGTIILNNVETAAFKSELPVSLFDFVATKNVDKPVFTLADSNGGNIEATPEVYTGPVDFLQYQLLGDTSGNVMAGSEFNDFLNLQDGDDAANGGDGQDVLDGGTGSNFLTGGAGGDTFYLDGRNNSTTWSTVTDFDSANGDTVNIWGWIEGISKLLLTEASAGAEGFNGITNHYDLNNDGVIDTSITFTGKTEVPVNSPQSVAGNGYLLFS